MRFRDADEGVAELGKASAWSGFHLPFRAAEVVAGIVWVTVCIGTIIAANRNTGETLWNEVRVQYGTAV